jgi:hypothetical protein
MRSLNFSYKAHCSPSCHSIGNYILHEGGPLFLTIAIYSVCGTFPFLSHISKHLSCYQLRTLGFMLWRFLSACESILAEGHCSTLIDNSRYLVCVPYPAPLPTAYYLQPISQPSLGLSLKLNILWVVI